jgi:sugar phosphate isomerase/epimerase
MFDAIITQYESKFNQNTVDFFEKISYTTTVTKLRRVVMIKTGLVSVSFRGLDVDEIIKITKEAGLEAIEWGSDVHAPCTDSEKLNYIAKAQRDAGLYCSSYGTYFRLGDNKTEEIRDYISAAKILGTDILRLWCGNKNYTDLTAEERAALINQAKELASIAEEEGVILCMECHNKTFTNCLEGALDLMQSVNSPAFRMFWQPSTLTSVDENIEYATKIAPYTYNIHTFYYENGEKRHLCDGIATWKKYMDCFAGERAMLLEFMPDGLPETLPKEAAALREIIK